MSASARTVSQILLEDGLMSRWAAKKALLSRKNIRVRLRICKRYREGLLSTGVKSFSLMNSLSDCLGHLEKSLSGEDKVSATIKSNQIKCIYIALRTSADISVLYRNPA